MEREDGRRETPAPKTVKTVPAWIKQAGVKPKVKPRDERDDEQQPTQPTRFNPTGAQTQPFTPPAWWNAQPQRPTTAAQFTTPTWWTNNNAVNWSVPSNPTLPTGTFFAGGNAVRTGQNTSTRNQMQVSEPSNPSLPTGTFFAGGNTMRTGEASGLRPLTTNPLNQRPRWSNGLAPAGEAGRPFQPSVTGYNLKNTSLTNGGGGGGGGWGTNKKKGKGGGGYGGYSYTPNTYADRAPSWLMNLTNWNFKG